MATLSDLFDAHEWREMLDEGYIRRQTHPTLPLAILNYSEKAQYEQRWNDVTLNCRGLIYNIDTEEVIARGFKKFFNWDDSSQPYPPHGPVLRMPKMDGSLGILYVTHTSESGYAYWAVATRGSFASDQALWATQHLNYHDFEYWDLADLNPAKSYLVEIIYPENRIVVNYDGAERLVLLDVLDTATGKSDLAEFDCVYWIDKVERTYIPGGFSDSFGHDIPEGEEGFVVYWPDRDYRVKMKSASYLELHRMIFSLSERSVWERMGGFWDGTGETVAEIAQKLPDEFHAWVNAVGIKLAYKFDDEERAIKREFEKLAKGMKLTDTRKEFAAKAAQSPNRAYLFMLYDGKPIEAALWKTLKPEGGKTVTTISEDVA